MGDGEKQNHHLSSVNCTFREEKNKTKKKANRYAIEMNGNKSKTWDHLHSRLVSPKGTKVILSVKLVLLLFFALDYVTWES